MENEISKLKQRWLATGSFKDEQAFLAEQVRLGGVKYVFVDPDGTAPPWIAVAVRHQTGVIYGSQCAGVATEERRIEGFLVPLGGWKYEPDSGRIDLDHLTDVFHEGDSCKYGWTGRNLPGERLQRLSVLVGEIPYWRCGFERSDRFAIHLDKNRIDEIAEAWIPVETPDGPGTLLYKNCD